MTIVAEQDWDFQRAVATVSSMFIRSRYPDMSYGIIAIAIVPHQPATAHGAVVLWQEGEDFYAEFFNAQCGIFEECAPCTPEKANVRYRELCRRFWVGIPKDTRPEKRKVLVEQIHAGMPTEVFHASFLLGHSHGVRGCPLGRGPTSAAAVEDLLFYSNFELLAGVSQIMRDDLTIEERML